MFKIIYELKKIFFKDFHAIKWHNTEQLHLAEFCKKKVFMLFEMYIPITEENFYIFHNFYFLRLSQLTFLLFRENFSNYC